MKTIIATAGAFTDTSIKLIPGRYALAFKAATTSGFNLSAGTLTLSQRLDQKAKFPDEAPETIDIPLLADVAPGADALTYDLSIAAQRRAHLEFVVSEPGSLLLTLTGATQATGALHVSCNPINA